MAAAAAAAQPPTNSQQRQRRVMEITRNGGMETTHAWSQTREEVSLHVFVPQNTRAADIVAPVVSYVQAGTVQHIIVGLKRMAPSFLIDADIAYPVDGSEDALDGCWSLEDIDDTRRAVRIDLRKVPPAPGAVIWWRKALATDTEIQQAALVDIDSSPAAMRNRAQWTSAWQDAHAAFLERVSHTHPTLL